MHSPCVIHLTVWNDDFIQELIEIYNLHDQAVDDGYSDRTVIAGQNINEYKCIDNYTFRVECIIT